MLQRIKFRREIKGKTSRDINLGKWKIIHSENMCLYPFDYCNQPATITEIDGGSGHNLNPISPQVHLQGPKSKVKKCNKCTALEFCRVLLVNIYFYRSSFHEELWLKKCQILLELTHDDAFVLLSTEIISTVDTVWCSWNTAAKSDYMSIQ